MNGTNFSSSARAAPGCRRASFPPRVKLTIASAQGKRSSLNQSERSVVRLPSNVVVQRVRAGMATTGYATLGFRH
jgi:hypothetical protein